MSWTVAVVDVPLHVDFLRLSKDARVTVNIPVRFTDEDDCPGIRRGGVLNIVRHDVELSCSADAIPDDLVASLAGLDIGESIHISAFTLPDGAKLVIDDRDFTVATIVAPSALKSTDEEEVTAEAPAADAEPAENGDTEE